MQKLYFVHGKYTLLRKLYYQRFFVTRNVIKDHHTCLSSECLQYIKALKLFKVWKCWYEFSTKLKESLFSLPIGLQLKDVLTLLSKASPKNVILKGNETNLPNVWGSQDFGWKTTKVTTVFFWLVCLKLWWYSLSNFNRVLQSWCIQTHFIKICTCLIPTHYLPVLYQSKSLLRSHLHSPSSHLPSWTFLKAK